MAEIKYNTPAGNASSVLGVEAYESTKPVTESAQVEEPLETEVEQALEETEVDTDALTAELDANIPVQEEEQKQTQETPEFTQFSEQFKQVVGVDLKEAITNYQELVNVSQQAIQQSQNAMREAHMQRQVLEVSAHWISDPDVQEQMKQGKSLQQVTNERLQSLARVYKSLPETLQQKIDAQGANGVISLYKSTKKGKQAPNSSSSTSQGSQQPQYKWSEIVGWPEERYNAEGRALLMNRNYIDDRG